MCADESKAERLRRLVAQSPLPADQFNELLVASEEVIRFGDNWSDRARQCEAKLARLGSLLDQLVMEIERGNDGCAYSKAGAWLDWLEGQEEKGDAG